MKLGPLFVNLVIFSVLACTSSKVPLLSAPGQDGSGRASVIPDNPVQAGSYHTWTVTYTASETGISKGGGVVFHIPPFWGWSPPQNTVPDRPGYISVSCSDKSLKPDIQINSANKYVLTRFNNAPLYPGQQVHLVYGAGAAGARTDIYAEKKERFYIKVDGNGDGYFTPIADHPRIDILPGPAAGFKVTAPSQVVSGRSFSVRVAAVDHGHNWNRAFRDKIMLTSSPEGISCSPGDFDNNSCLFVCSTRKTGTFVLTATGKNNTLGGKSNPVVSTKTPPRFNLYWGDIHGHSRLSDGTGTAADYFTYARFASGLDMTALTDHDAWGFDRLDNHPEIWEFIKKETETHNRPGRFITFPGYEYTNWTSGHMHVLFKGEPAPLFSSANPQYDNPDKLWQALAGCRAITVPHHPGGGPIGTDWNYYNPEFTFLAEICSIHGNSETADAPRGIYKPQPGAFVRDALDRGYRLGIIASGDTHNGHPGMGDPSSPTGGLVAVYAKTLTRDAVWEALKKRRVYGTSGKRIILDFRINGHMMGGTIQTEPRTPVHIDFGITGTDRLKLVEIIKNGKSIRHWSWTAPSFSATLIDRYPSSGDYYYLRVVQQDDHLAWSSPIWVE